MRMRSLGARVVLCSPSSSRCRPGSRHRGELDRLRGRMMPRCRPPRAWVRRRHQASRANVSLSINGD